MAIPNTSDGPAPQERHAASLVELLSDWYWEQDAEFRLTVVSSRRADNAADPFPYVGRKHWEQPALNLTETDWERHRAQLEWHQAFRDFEVQHATDDGRVVWISLSGQPVFDDGGTFTGYRGIGRDVTAQKRSETLTRLEHAIARELAQAATTSDGVRAALRLICEAEDWDAGRCFRVEPANGELTYAEGWFTREGEIEQLLRGSRAAATPVGYARVGKGPGEIPAVRPDHAGWQAHKATLESRLPFRDFEVARATPDGGTRYFSVSGQPHHDARGSFIGYRGVGRDVTEIALARERIASLAYSDPLTGLANRVSLAPALDQAIERCKRHGAKIAGVFVDLDGFKQINDRHGHAAGDAFLVEVAQRLRRHVRASDLVARLGGDEFFVMLEGVQDMVGVERVVVKLVDALRKPYTGIGEAQRRISATLGVSLFPDDAPDASTLIQHADEAMYTAKQAGKNAYCLYSTGRKPAPMPPGDAADAAIRSADPFTGAARPE